MTTINERAKRYGSLLNQGLYISASKEQQQIDTEVFCELFYELLNENHIDCKDSAYVESRIRKALENDQ